MNPPDASQPENQAAGQSNSSEPEKVELSDSGVNEGRNRDDKRVYPPRGWVVAWMVWLLLAMILHLAAGPIADQIPVIDQAVRNVFTFVTMLGVPFWILLWWAYFSDLGTPLLRKSVFWGYVLLEIALVAVMILFVEFDGNLSPIGWKRERKLDIEVVEGEVDLRTTTAEDFPQYLGPDRNAMLPDTRLATDWKQDPPRMIWKHPIGAGHSGFATRNGFAVTMEQRGDEELTTCYDLATGDLMWTYGTRNRHETLFGKLGPRSTPTIHEGRVYSLGANGHLACLEGATGQPVWTRELFEEFGTTAEQEADVVKWGRAASPLVFDDQVVVPAGGPPGGPFVSLVSYDRNTGDELWRGGDQQISYASPVLVRHVDDAGNTFRWIVSVNEAHVTAHDPESGKTLWSIDRPGSSAANANTSQPVVLPDQSLLLTKGYGLGAQRIQVDQGEPVTLWQNTALLKTKFTNAVFYQDYAFALSDGRLECIDWRKGERIWKSRKNYGHGQILLCGSDLLVLSETGQLLLIPIWDEAGRTVVANPDPASRIQALDGSTWNTIALTGNLLLVRNSQQAACYEMPLRSDR